ncbi:hypothetical protein VT930_11880 [Mycobacterium sherrisii]|uniref:hypothetical protein n=1 Tax=Mycobacterium sherrisii TaxID=243061 RepID=UPI002DDD7040|nr:hypothetical protein [Mycobacterium sherrisii]MEC4763803.1 hypothetical protein [Mycobacterium sherrisii]
MTGLPSVALDSEVCVYRNLKTGSWSITGVKGNDNRGPLLFHANELVLTECRAVVKESRRKRIESGGWREVCAWFVGRIDENKTLTAFCCAPLVARVTFHPHERGTFFRTDTGDDVLDADAILFAAGGDAWLL